MLTELFPETMEASAGIRLLLAAVYVGICSVQDFRSRKISLPVTVCFCSSRWLLKARQEKETDTVF